ncbi:hypothetical protein E2C01_064651 [Portunus trituberculatus]|uniref:Uncharacterized protein n=1 Tax=Portunus trituberculatus TaxID=210409 RepID=A0A5B7HGP7_PORTR|nr:hypothetical protein [Portunus trituberculatus]
MSYLVLHTSCHSVHSKTIQTLIRRKPARGHVTGRATLGVALTSARLLSSNGIHKNQSFFGNYSIGIKLCCVLRLLRLVNANLRAGVAWHGVAWRGRRGSLSRQD